MLYFNIQCLWLIASGPRNTTDTQVLILSLSTVTADDAWCMALQCMQASHSNAQQLQITHKAQDPDAWCASIEVKTVILDLWLISSYLRLKAYKFLYESPFSLFDTDEAFWSGLEIERRYQW